MEQNEELSTDKQCDIHDVMRMNFDLLLKEMEGDEIKTRTCLKYMTWLIKDIEINKGIDLEEYKDIWENAFSHSCA